MSGVVINTCGWVQAEGYDHIKHIAQVRGGHGVFNGLRLRYLYIVYLQAPTLKLAACIKC